MIDARTAPRPFDTYPHFAEYRDPDQIRVDVAKYHCDHIYNPKGAPNAWMNALRVPGAAFTGLGYGVESFVMPGQLDFYVVMYLCTGSGTFQYGLDSVDRTAGQAVVVSTQKPLQMTVSDDFVVACFRIDESTLEHHLEGVLGDALTAPLEFDLAMNDHDERAVEWQNLFHGVGTKLNNPSSLLNSHRNMTYHAVGLLVGGLVQAQPNTYSDRIERTSRVPVSDSRVDRVLDYVVAHSDEIHTLASLARVACCSKEALNRAFNRAIGVPPKACAGFIRLQGARRDLIASDPTTITVKHIAEKWGFRRPNHFAKLYSAIFDESPKVTLRRAARAPVHPHAPSVAQLQHFWRVWQASK